MIIMTEPRIYYGTLRRITPDIDPVWNTTDVFIFTDGSCRSKDCGGLGIIAVTRATSGTSSMKYNMNGCFMKKHLTAATESPYCVTNIRAEGHAINEAFKYILSVADPNTRYVIAADSMFWIDMMFTYMPNWLAADKMTDHENADICETMIKNMYDIITKRIHLDVTHVKAHVTNNTRSVISDTVMRALIHYNSVVDELASSASDNSDVCSGPHFNNNCKCET